jgi:hypothetical protein
MSRRAFGWLNPLAAFIVGIGAARVAYGQWLFGAFLLVIGLLFTAGVWIAYLRRPAIVLRTLPPEYMISAADYQRFFDQVDAPTDHELVTDHRRCEGFWPECKEGRSEDG